MYTVEGDLLLQIRVSERPWGQLHQFAQNRHITVKVITIEPGHRLSLQRHRHRAELWHVLDVPMNVTVDGRSWTADVGEQILVASRASAPPGQRPEATWPRGRDRVRRLRRD